MPKQIKKKWQRDNHACCETTASWGCLEDQLLLTKATWMVSRIENAAIVKKEVAALLVYQYIYSLRERERVQRKHGSLHA